MATAKCTIALLVVAMAVGCTHAQGLTKNFIVLQNSSDGGQRFEAEIGINNATKILEDAFLFVWATFNQTWPNDTKNVSDVDVYVGKPFWDVDAYTKNNVIYLSSDYISRYEGDLLNEIKGILYQQSTYIWEWDNNGEVATWWIGAVPRYVRLTAGFAHSNFAPPGSGNSWEQSFEITARFLQYCDTVTPGFVGRMNAKVKNEWNLGLFKDVTGKSVEDLWSDYKAKYQNGSEQK